MKTFIEHGDRYVSCDWERKERMLLDRKLKELLGDDYAETISIENINLGCTVLLGVTWASLEDRHPDDAVEFANLIMQAADLAAAYPYNGYIVSYKDECKRENFSPSEKIQFDQYGKEE